MASNFRCYCQNDGGGRMFSRIRVLPWMLMVSIIIGQMRVARGELQVMAEELGVEYLTVHNEARRELQMGVRDLVWDHVMYLHATDWADILAGEGCIGLQADGPYGENILRSNGEWSPKEVVEFWLQEKRHYHEEDNTCEYEEDCSHYTQMVWRTTEKLGCGAAKCDDGSWIHVCNYDPPGNYGGMPYQTLWADS